ncbi:PTH-type GPCR protein, partial [Trichoderma reesei QM6a]
MALQTVTFPILPVVKTHLIINSVLVGAAVVIVGFRVFARIVTGAKLWWDDYLILLSMPLGIGMLVIQGLYAPMGVGRQISETQPNLVIILKLTIAYALSYTSCITIIKLSILCFYLRVFPNSKLRIATQIVIGIVSLWGLGSVLMFFFVCRPFEATWNPLVGGTCADRIATFLAVGAYNIISDIIILTLPLRTIWTLNTRSQMKVALTILFLTGLLVSVVAVCRIITLTHLNMDNVTGTMVWADFLSTLEANLGIICVSLPMLGPLVVKYTKGRGARKL